MNTSRIAAAAMAAALLLLCPSRADASEDRATDEQARCSGASRTTNPSGPSERQDLQKTERQSDGSEIPKVVDQERPAMPIPIPGVGRHESGETIDS